MKATLKNSHDIEALRAAAMLVSRTLGEVGRAIKPGVATIELDQLAEAYIRDNGGIPAFKHYAPHGLSPFPFTLCVSINHEVVHGFSSEQKVIQEDDIVSIDCGVQLNGYFGDSAYTYVMPAASEAKKELCMATKQSLFEAIELAHEGSRLGDIGHAVQSYVEARGYSVVREMVGHGLGKRLHEPPEVLNYGKPGSGGRLKKGMVLCIEPMINLGAAGITTSNGGWVIETRDAQPSAHYELTVAVGREQADILSTFAFAEAAERENVNLSSPELVVTT